ncbi:hypothetical protein L218DRAFT_1075444 [Marasmius fiardii PR-910]|nr:hypothetical protein L218DRAFT_1075444 [Marasmius fiardii PR-910]
MLCEICQALVEPDVGSQEIQPIDSRFQRPDYVLSAEEKFHMSRGLEEESRCLENYEDQIIRMRRKLAILEEGKRILEGNILQRRSALSIQRLLPIEIWEIIFAFVCSLSSEGSRSLVIDRSRPRTLPFVIMPPVVLSHVCSRWRTIVLTYPILWSSIRIVLDKIAASSLPLFETFIERSEGGPLDLEIKYRLGAFSRHKMPKDVHTYWETVSKNIPRCRTLSFGIVHCALLGNVPPANDFSLPNLVSFWGTTYSHSINPTNWFWQALSQAPKLSFAEIHQPYPLNSLPYSQLTTLSIRRLIITDDGLFDELYRVLQSSRKLRHLKLQLDSPSMSRPNVIELDRFPAIQMPCLSTLTVNIETSVLHDNSIDMSFGALYNTLLMPPLVTLKLECSSFETDRWSKTLLVMLQHSPLLTRLSLCFRGCYGPAFYPKQPLSTILYSIPNLTHLELYLSRSDRGQDILAKELFSARDCFSSFLSDLKYSPRNNMTFVPKLEFLSLRLYHKIADDFTLMNLLDAAGSRVRKDVDSPLREIRVRRYAEQLGSKIALGSNVLEEIDSLEQVEVFVTVEDVTEIWDAFEDEG